MRNLLIAILTVGCFVVNAAENSNEIKVQGGKAEFEAEKAKTSGSMKVVEHEKASGKKLVKTTSKKAGTAEYIIIVDADGTYELWGLVAGKGGNGDSFFIEINESGKLTWDVKTQKDGVWAWRKLKGRKKNKTGQFELKKGKNTLKLSKREPNAEIDKLKIKKVK
jgi:hypothetical protein